MASLLLIAVGLAGFLSLLALVVALAAAMERRLGPIVRLVDRDPEEGDL